MSTETKEKWRPVLYANYYNMMKGIAESHGYALAVHGSFTRDMDLIAVPWTETASSQKDLVKALYEIIGWYHGEDSAERVFNDRTEKPNGRTAYAIPTGGGSYVDISIMRIYTDEAKLD